MLQIFFLASESGSKFCWRVGVLDVVAVYRGRFPAYFPISLSEKGYCIAGVPGIGKLLKLIMVIFITKN